MKRTTLALLVAALAVTGAHASTTFQDRWSPVDQIKNVQVSQANTTSTPGSVVVTPAPASNSAPGTTTTVVVHGGDLAAKILDWFWVAFGGTVGLMGTAVLYKVFGYFGIQTTDVQRAQLQSIIVNGLNAAAAKSQTSLRGATQLDFASKSQIVADAVVYAQDHAAETMKALGLDPKSGEAVEAIKARIETALNDPNTPTPPSITPPTDKNTQPLAPAA